MRIPRIYSLLDALVPVALAAMIVSAAVMRFSAVEPNTALAAGEKRTPVLVELFTSEGCSSCPPADAFMNRLDTEQPVPNARVIVLSEHVTYWDHLGWRDPFSLDEVTDRQQNYANSFGLDSVYTPQAVVDGSAQFVGSDAAGLTRAITHAAQAEKINLDLRDVRLEGDALHFRVQAGTSTPGATVFAAIALDAAKTDVASGENAGRSLRYVAVARILKNMGAGVADGRPLSIQIKSVAKDQLAAPLRLIVFVTDRRTGHVLGAAEESVTRSGLSPQSDLSAGGLQSTLQPGPAPLSAHRP
jgi:hypothetical protein